MPVKILIVDDDLISLLQKLENERLSSPAAKSLI